MSAPLPSEEELRRRLTPLQYHVTQEKGTETAFSGDHAHDREAGRYTCVCCGVPLFASEAKYDSGSGWPSFQQPCTIRSVRTTIDRSHGLVRTEVSCARCGAHLGHVFEDGPPPGGLRYCINSASLDFQSDTSSPSDP
jgi:peptide-methionine (R)-S-oxide reductase